MKNFEESLRQLDTPAPRAETFQRKLRRDLALAGRELSLRRWRRACLAACSLSVVLTIGLATSLTGPGTTAIAEGEISEGNDREFIEAFYARQGSDVQVQSVDAERLVAIREFTLSDGRKMMVYTESDEGRADRSLSGMDTGLPMLASHSTSIF